MIKASVKEILNSTDLLKEFECSGWVRSFRSNRFIALNDGSCLENLQCVVDFEKMDEAVLNQINTGAAIRIQGTLKESEVGGQRVE